MDSALLILRLVGGLLVAGHGAQKLFGWFGGLSSEEQERLQHLLGRLHRGLE